MSSLIFINGKILLVLGIMQVILGVALIYMIVANRLGIKQDISGVVLIYMIAKRSTVNAIVFAIVFQVILFMTINIYYLLIYR